MRANGWQYILARFFRTEPSVIAEVNGEITTQREDTAQPHSVDTLRETKSPLTLYSKCTCDYV